MRQEAGSEDGGDSQYLSIVGGLRYDRDVIHRILGEVVMNISIHELRDSSVYQAIAAEAENKGLEKGRAETVYEMLRLAAARRFPGIKLGEEIKSIADLEALEDMCLTMHELADVESLHTRLAALMPKNL